MNAEDGSNYCLDNTPYSFEQNLGQGSYGFVCKAIDKVRILRLVEHENIVKVSDAFMESGNQPNSTRDLYMVMTLMESNLHIVMRTNKLDSERHRWILLQILLGLKYLHSARIIHRDLSPSNILLDKQSNVRICDFGMARSIESVARPEDLTIAADVTPLAHQAPEMLLLMPYDEKLVFPVKNIEKLGCTGVDIWAAGCILGEMMKMKSLFLAKECTPEAQLTLLLSQLGSLDETMLELSPLRRASAASLVIHKYFRQLYSEKQALEALPGLAEEVAAVEALRADELRAALEREVALFIQK